MHMTPLKWHGGKHYLADWIIGHMPPHTHYVEPYAGGLSVLLRKPHEGISEVVNDLDGDLTNFWRVLRSPYSFGRFARCLDAMPFSAVEFDRAIEGEPLDDVDRAVRFFMRCRQSRQGLRKDFATLSRNRTRRGMNEQVSAWLTAVAGLPEVHRRLRRVVILQDDAVERRIDCKASSAEPKPNGSAMGRFFLAFLPSLYPREQSRFSTHFICLRTNERNHLPPMRRTHACT